MIPFELILKLRGFPIKEASDMIAGFDPLPRAAKEEWIHARKWAIARHHAHHNAFYRKQMGPTLCDRWTDLPILRKSDLQQPLENLLSESYTPGTIYVSNTSGSSGHPFTFARDKFTHAMAWARILKSYSQLGAISNSVQARFYGIPLGKTAYVKELIKDYFMNRIRFIVFDMGDSMLERFLRRFENRRIDYVYGYTNSLLLFARFLERKGIVLSQRSPNLFLCIVTSEVCTEEDKSFLQKTFGVTVVREYGASELDVIAIENLQGRWSINESNVLVEVVSEEGKVLPLGEEGRLIITSLHNKAMPFIRYEVGDVGALEQDGQGLYLKSLSGRINDTVLLPSGKRSPGFTFYYVSRGILENNGSLIKEFIIRQTALDSFEFDVVAFSPLTEQEISNIKKIMDQYLEPGLRLKVNQVTAIVRPPSGKIKHFYSQISKPAEQNLC